MEEPVTLEVLTVEETANRLNLEPDTILKAIESGDLKVESADQIPGPALSRWWKKQGGKPVLLEDYLDRVPWLPVLLVEATELFKSKEIAREWLLEKNVALRMKTPLEFAETEEGASEVLQLIGRLKHGIHS